MMVVYLLALLVAVLWFAFLSLLLMSGQTSKARVQQRFYRMLEEAETERGIQLMQQAGHQAASEEVVTHYRFADLSFVNRVVRPMLQSLSETLSQFAPSELWELLETQILRMGKQDSWSVMHLAACWVLSVIVGLSLGFLLVHSIPALRYPQGFMVLLLGAATGATAPFFFLQSAIQRRKERLRRQMPEFIDLICISVQAGLSFDGAVSKITERMKGALSEEFQRMQRDIRHGMTRQRSLTQMAKRCDIEEMYLFTSAVIQADRLGTSMGRTLKMQADNIRDRYRQTVRAEAMKAPVKIIFPMIIFIFPSIFVITLLPIALTMMHTFEK